MTREEAIEVYNGLINTKIKEAFEFFAPELAESEDERIRKEIIDFIQWAEDRGMTRHDYHQAKRPAVWIDYLEKQKEQKPLFKQISDSVIWDSGLRTGIELGKKEQKPNIELIQCSWYMEGYYDREFGKEPKWIVKTGEGGPKYEENPKYGQMLEAEQKPVEWSEDFEDNIRNLLHDKLTGHSDDGSMSWATLIDDKTLKDIVSGIWFYVGKEALKYPNKELNVSKWSEEDDAAHTRILGAVAKAFMGVLPTKPSEEDVNWLKTLPERFNLQPKQEWSEEDEKMLDKVCCLINPGTILNASDADYCLELKQWIVSLQERIFKLSRTQPKQEWNKEDKIRLDSIISDYRELLQDYKACHGVDYIPYTSDTLIRNVVDDVDFLKSLLLQPHTVSMKDATKFGNLEYERGVKDGIQSEKSHHWKPSEEQMGSLNYAYCELFKREDVDHNILGPLQNLIDTLRKL